MIFAIILLSVILLVAFVAAVCAKGSGLASRQEEYLEENEKQKQKDNTQLMEEVGMSASHTKEIKS